MLLQTGIGIGKVPHWEQLGWIGKLDTNRNETYVNIISQGIYLPEDTRKLDIIVHLELLEDAYWLLSMYTSQRLHLRLRNLPLQARPSRNWQCERNCAWFLCTINKIIQRCAFTLETSSIVSNALRSSTLFLKSSY